MRLISESLDEFEDKEFTMALTGDEIAYIGLVSQQKEGGQALVATSPYDNVGSSIHTHLGEIFGDRYLAAVNRKRDRVLKRL